MSNVLAYNAIIVTSVEVAGVTVDHNKSCIEIGLRHFRASQNT